MADLTQLLYGASLEHGSVTVGQVISASGSLVARDSPAFGDCDNAAQSIKVGRYGYGELSVQAVWNSGSGADLSQLLRGSTFSFATKAVGQVISVSGTCMTRSIPEFSDCDNDLKAALVGTYAWGPVTVTAVYDPTATTGAYAIHAAKAVNATPTGAAVFTFGDTSVLTAATAILTNIDIPSAGSDSDRLVVSMTVQPVNGSAWVQTVTTGDWADLLALAIASDPDNTTTLTWADGSVLEADHSVVTRLDFPSAGSESDRVVQSLSIRPVSGGAWSFTGKA